MRFKFFTNFIVFLQREFCRISNDIFMHKVLVVDDERPAREYITELIVRFLPDSKITQAENAQEAMRYLRANQYDLMFLDVEMHTMTGLQMLEHIKLTDGKKADIPYTFVVTAFRKYEYAVTGFRLGILDYIEKPLHDEKIYVAIKMYLDKIKSDTIELNVPDGLRRVQISELLAVKIVSRRKVIVFTSSKVYTNVTLSLKELSARLPSHFCYIRRECIVNMQEVKRYNQKMREIIFVCENENHVFTVSREHNKEIAAQLVTKTIEK